MSTKKTSSNKQHRTICAYIFRLIQAPRR